MLPFTDDMEELVTMYEKQSGGLETYNHIVLVIYMGADLCASCVFSKHGQPHGSKKCASWLGAHRDNGGGSNSQVESSMIRTLTVGAPRVLSLEMLRKSDHVGWAAVESTAVDFELTDGSVFTLDTDDEIMRRRVCSDGRSEVVGAWFHGMMTPVHHDEVSCGFVARHVHVVRDVCISSNVVITAAHIDQKRQLLYQTVRHAWKHVWSPIYRQHTAQLVQSAVDKWSRRRSRRKL